MQEFIELAASCDADVLILGQTGTGKSSLAKVIHQKSARKGRPFVTVNLASLHEGTLESELFGHERGAYTGADQRRIGKFELAQGGTLFLDEVGELSLRLQARILEVLQSRTFTPVGSNREVKLDVRIISATHRDLEKGIFQNEFREDLLHRLRVLTIELPSLRDQATDFDQILHGVIEEMSARYDKRVLHLDEGVAHVLENYRWPGNFRELRNVIESSIVSLKGTRFGIEHLPKWFLRAIAGATPSLPRGELLKVAELSLTLNYQETADHFEKVYFTNALVRFGGRINLTARKIGINKSTLIRKVKHLGIDRMQFQ
jgi:two-component system nitrogen regulation response regulator NtrX